MVLCPHCRVEFHASPRDVFIVDDADGAWGARTSTCPACKKALVLFGRGTLYSTTGGRIIELQQEDLRLIRPRGALRPHPPADVPKDIANDFLEAALVAPDSPKASAALSRRCLQSLLQQAAETKKKDLADQIDEVLAGKSLPSYLAEALDHVRQTGNYAAHPVKSRSTGEIVQVEPGEAELNLDVLEGLFDFFYVQPAKLRARLDATNKKLADAGKPPLKK